MKSRTALVTPLTLFLFPILIHADREEFSEKWTQSFPNAWDLWTQTLADVQLQHRQLPADVDPAQLTAVNAAWFGYDSNDATKALQAAIDSGAATVFVPNMGEPWIVRPILLRSNLTLILDKGVEILAKQGAFQGRHESLLSGKSLHNITIIGFGATLRMRKQDYTQPPYQKAEWRMGIALRSVENVQIEGLTIASTGGDGIYLGVDNSSDLRECRNVWIKDCVFDDNFRQGISVISAVNLLIERCFFTGTSGTGPAAGLDFEPNRHDEALINNVVRHCIFTANHGAGILAYLRHMDNQSRPISILIENCHIQSGESFGIALGGAGGRDHTGPKGLFLVRNTVVENTARAGAYIYHKDRDSLDVIFANCIFRNTAHAPDSSTLPRPGLQVGVFSPLIVFKGSQNWTTRSFGGVQFNDVLVLDDRERPFLLIASDDPEAKASAVQHRVRWINSTTHHSGVQQLTAGNLPIDTSGLEPHH